VAEGRVLTADEIRRFAELDSRDVLLAKLAGMAKGQIARTAWMIQALQSKFVLLMEALKDKLPSDESRTPGDSSAGSDEAVGSSPVTRGVPSDEPPATGANEPEASAEPAPLAGGADAHGTTTVSEQADETEQDEGGA
jgi:hypothetical protein